MVGGVLAADWKMAAVPVVSRAQVVPRVARIPVAMPPVARIPVAVVVPVVIVPAVMRPVSGVVDGVVGGRALGQRRRAGEHAGEGDEYHGGKSQHSRHLVELLLPVLFTCGEATSSNSRRWSGDKASTRPSRRLRRGAGVAIR